ncbi:phosphoserine phosphatase SerB [Orrella sp. JC864]|uniref:phosphoserine phosphatase SerB n=1 Tax=Orrella sp. JC864 TaxID=3120298 RepID=UPI00300BF630
MSSETTHLVVQSPALSAEAVEQAAAVAMANGSFRINATAVRLTDVATDEQTRRDVREWCAQAGVDYAYVPARHRLADYKVLAMDMDSTLINIECIDEIADFIGKKAQVAAITEAAMRGEIRDFSESLRRRVALLEGTPSEALERVYEDRLRLNPGAEKLVEQAHAAGLKVLLVSGGFTYFTDRLRERLSLDAAHANVLEIDNGVLTGRVLGDIVDAYGKALHLREFAQRHGARNEQIIAIGDGANDLQMLGLAGISVAYRAKPVVREQTRYALSHSGLDGVLNWFET